MKVQILTRGERFHSYQYEVGFKDGLKRHSVNAYLSDSTGKLDADIDLLVLWGVRNKRKILDAQQMGINYLVLERGYIGNRREYTSCGFNGLNGKANFVNKGLGDYRSRHFKHLLQPYQKNRGNHIIIMGQVESDASVQQIGWQKWLKSTYKSLKRITKRPIYFRQHPLAINQTKPCGLPEIFGDLQHTIKNAHCVVTLNSNSGVDALLAGVPCITMDAGSMAYEITSHDLINVNTPIFNDRQQWFNELAFCQWNIEEIKRGDAWAHLKTIYET